jgi:uncharacterized protein
VTLTLALFAAWQGYEGHALVISSVVCLLLLAGELLPAARAVSEVVRHALPVPIAWLVAVPLIAEWLAYALGTGSFATWRASILCAYVLVPLALLSLAVTGSAPGALDYLAWVAVALPLKTYWLRWLFPWPPQAAHVFAALLLMNVAVAGFLFLRRTEGVGYSLAWGKGWLQVVAGSFLVIAAIVIPLGLWLKFLHWGPAHFAPAAWGITLLGIFFFTAWPEEFLFRGLLQNMLSKSLGSERGGWVLASILFGFAHITNGGFPNWRYVLLASIAGFFYAYAWRKTGSIFASALVHAAVDFFWHILFR